MAEQNVTPKQRMAKASMWCGIIAAVLGIAPLLSGWFLMLVWLVWILAILAIIFGIIALIKKQPMIKAIIGIVLAIFGVLCPYLFAEAFASNAVDSTVNMLNTVNDLTGESMFE